MSKGPRQALAVVLALGACLFAAGAAVAEPPSIASRQSQAQSVLAEVEAIDAALGRAVESYNLANLKLARIEREARLNRARLRVARANLHTARGTLSSRLVSIYMNGQQASTLEVLLGARSFDDLVDGLETVNRLSDQDSRVLGQVIVFRTEVERRRLELARARVEQSRIVATRAAERSRIESRLARRRALLASIRSEIARMQAAERTRQAALAQQLQGRLPSLRAGEAVAGFGVGAVSPDGASVAPPARFGGVVGIAMQYIGVPYRWGGASPSTGFDCSGFIMFVFAQVGVSLPHSTYALWGMGSPVSRDQLAPGDIVFFNGLGHAGIYIGSGQMIHAPHTGDFVKIAPLHGGYVGARRI